MRIPVTTSRAVLHARLTHPAQEAPLQPEGDLPPYMESFLAHLRCLVGVPFEYLVPDERLLPTESIRFFYLDRSWADRLIDGAVAVGQIGSREEAHYQARASVLAQVLDQSERMVRPLQRGEDFVAAKRRSDANPRDAEVVTGFVLRSSAVRGWPHMDVRAYDRTLPEPFTAGDPQVAQHQLRLLRLEVLSPSVLIALFEGEPKMVIIEEPHHGVQFGVRHRGSGLAVPLRDATGQQILVNNQPVPVTVPTRSRHRDVVRVAALRDALQAARTTHPQAVAQNGAAAFAISVLDPPWRQHFEGTEDHADTGEPRDRSFVNVTDIVQRAGLLSNVKLIMGVP
jgi:hypothetical protein